jgi:hypothetical protein
MAPADEEDHGPMGCASIVPVPLSGSALACNDGAPPPISIRPLSVKESAQNRFKTSYMVMSLMIAERAT